MEPFVSKVFTTSKSVAITFKCRTRCLHEHIMTLVSPLDVLVVVSDCVLSVLYPLRGLVVHLC